MKRITVYFQFASQLNDNVYTFQASEDVNHMLKQILEQSQHEPHIDQASAKEEYDNFYPPYGLTIEELDFDIIGVDNIPKPKINFAQEAALIELKEMIKGYQMHGELFCKAYRVADDAEHALYIIESHEVAA